MAHLPPALQDHFRAPRHAGRLERPSARGEAQNEACGDRLELELVIEGERVARIGWQGRGCSAVIVSASLLCESLSGLDVERAATFDLAQQVHALGGFGATRRHGVDVAQRALALALADWRQRCHS